MIRTSRSLVDPDALAAVVAHAYQVRVDRCVLLRSLVNDVYRADTPAGSHVVKLYRAGHHSVDDVAWEVRLSAELGDVVAGGRWLADGSAAGVLDTAEGPRPYAMFDWLPGSNPGPSFDIRRYGEATARLHAAADRVDPPPRPRRTAPIDDVLSRLGDTDRDLVQRLARTATDRLAGLELDTGVCHGDVSLDNLHVDGDRVAFYDLDQAHTGPRAGDLAGVAATDWFDEFLAGYRAVRPLGTDDLAAVRWLGVLDRVQNLRFHLVDKPLLRGTESLGEGWVEENLDALRAERRDLGDA